MEEDELVKLWFDIESAIVAVRQPSNIKKIKHNYFTNFDDDKFFLLFEIIVAEIRQNAEKIYEKRQAGIWQKMVEAERAKPKRRGRPAKAETLKDVNVTKTTNVGGLKVETVR